MGYRKYRGCGNPGATIVLYTSELVDAHAYLLNRKEMAESFQNQLLENLEKTCDYSVFTNRVSQKIRLMHILYEFNHVISYFECIKEELENKPLLNIDIDYDKWIGKKWFSPSNIIHLWTDDDFYKHNDEDAKGISIYLFHEPEKFNIKDSVSLEKNINTAIDILLQHSEISLQLIEAGIEFASSELDDKLKKIRKLIDAEDWKNEDFESIAKELFENKVFNLDFVKWRKDNTPLTKDIIETRMRQLIKDVIDCDFLKDTNISIGDAEKANCWKKLKFTEMEMDSDEKKIRLATLCRFLNYSEGRFDFSRLFKLGIQAFRHLKELSEDDKRKVADFVTHGRLLYRELDNIDKDEKKEDSKHGGRPQEFLFGKEDKEKEEFWAKVIISCIADNKRITNKILNTQKDNYITKVLVAFCEYVSKKEKPGITNYRALFRFCQEKCKIENGVKVDTFNRGFINLISDREYKKDCSTSVDIDKHVNKIKEEERKLNNM